MQYYRPAEGEGMVVAFRRHQSPSDSFVCELHEVDAAADYEVTRSPRYTPTAPVRMKGAQLRTLRVEIDERPGSLVIEYKRVGGKDRADLERSKWSSRTEARPR